MARALGILDVLAALAEVAALPPVLPPPADAGAGAGPHGRAAIPSSSGCCPPGGFVPNDVALDPESQVLIVTGPNMSGKSTILRQVALTVLLAHLGSFVPAAEAIIGLTDRIFTRVGAVDDIGRGQSTFLVEMNETARILHQATPRSLVILDEIGRGTSTFDGLALAWAVAEHLHDLDGVRGQDPVRHPLPGAHGTLPPQAPGQEFSGAGGGGRRQHRVSAPAGPGRRPPELRHPGGQAGRGAPGGHRRAQEVLENLEAGSLDPMGLPRLARHRRRPAREVPQPKLFGGSPG